MITGKTRLYYMMADPIGHVRTPEVMNPIFQERGIDAVMVPLHFAAADFATGWEALRRTRNLGGCVISVPLKEQAFALADEVTPEAAELGAANTVRRDPDGRMIATNFDGEGFLEGLLAGGKDAAGRKALLLGAGGAGRAISFALARSGVSSLRIHDVDAARAEAVAARVRHHYPDCKVEAGDADSTGCDLVVNATPCGLHPETDPLPLDLSQLRPDMIVADIIMKPRETPLLLAAKQIGCDVRYGAGMLDAQIELMMRFMK